MRARSNWSLNSSVKLFGKSGLYEFKAKQVGKVNGVNLWVMKNNKMAKGKKTKQNQAQKKRVPAREGAEETLKMSEVQKS